MTALTQFKAHLPPSLRAKIQNFKTPFEVQEYLLSLTYKGEVRDRSPLNVMLDGQGHCLDGGFLAALLLWNLGFKPLLLDLRADPGMDDDHVLALYQLDGRWGAVAKSNYVNLGFREAVHKSTRELAMTYFEHYASVHQTKTLRYYTRPFDAAVFPLEDWGWNEDSANRLYKKFYRQKPIPLIDQKMAARLNPVTNRNYAAETLYTNLKESFGNRDE